MNDTITCRRCARHIVPQVSYCGGGFVRHTKFEHICPFCGKRLGYSGGGLRAWAIVLAIIMLGPILIQIGSIVLHSFTHLWKF